MDIGYLWRSEEELVGLSLDFPLPRHYYYTPHTSPLFPKGATTCSVASRTVFDGRARGERSRDRVPRADGRPRRARVARHAENGERWLSAASRRRRRRGSGARRPGAGSPWFHNGPHWAPPPPPSGGRVPRAHRRPRLGGRRGRERWNDTVVSSRVSCAGIIWAGARRRLGCADSVYHVTCLVRYRLSRQYAAVSRVAREILPPTSRSPDVSPVLCVFFFFVKHFRRHAKLVRISSGRHGRRQRISDTRDDRHETKVSVARR